LEIIQGARRVCDFHMAFNLPYVYKHITNCAGNKQKSYKIMRINMFIAEDKAKPDTKNIRGLNFVPVKPKTVQVIELLF
jgi:hypothetical protein